MSQTLIAIKQQHWAIQLLRIFKSLSFVFAIFCTVVAGADADLSTRGMMLKVFVKKKPHVDFLRA